jgi:hypothetical protein
MCPISCFPKKLHEKEDTHTYIYIYIYRERERERERGVLENKMTFAAE